MALPKYTLRDFEAQFPDDAACLEWLKDFLYPDGIHCKRCKRITTHHRANTRPSYCCDRCGNHVHPTAGTIYHKSSTPLRLWFYAIFIMASTRYGISAKQLERELGVTYKTAWRMFKQIRSMLAGETAKMYGRIEIDETYIGGRKSRKGRATGFENKTPVLGIAERDTKIMRATALPDATRATILPIVRERLPSKFTAPLPKVSGV
jgi:transposase